MPVADEGTVTRRAPRRDAVRNDKLVLDAARAVFAERGPHAGMEDVAARAGVGIGSIYRRFRNKEALLDAIADHLVREIDEAAAAALTDKDAGRALAGFLEFVGEFATEKARYATDLVERVTDHETSAATVEKVGALTRNAVAAGALAPHVTPADIRALIVAIRAVVAQAGPGDGPTWRRFLQHHLDGLRAAR